MNFTEKVYELTRKIPRGKVTTYGEIAKAIGKPDSARAVGQALRHNPFAPKVPCHRIIASSGDLHGFAGKFRNPEKARMLREEGIEVENNKVDLEKFGFRF